MARAIAYIERNLTSRTLTPAAVAEAVHVSRSTLYRMFSPSGGVNRYILRARLDLARSVLADPGPARRVSDVAFDSGFLSEAHFCRAFRRAFGVTPGGVHVAAQADIERDRPTGNGPDVSPGGLG